MVKKLDKREHTAAIDFEPSEGERTLLSSNESSMRSPSLDLENTITPEEKELLKRLAKIVIEAIIWDTKHERQQ